MNDTRKDARLSVALVTRYREPTMLEPREGECRDLSLSGMFITTQRPSPRGALIRFECVSDQPEDGFRGTGRVVWQRNKADDRGPAGMGVRFVRLESGGREALERTLERIGAGRPPSRTPRPSNRAPANARARQEEAHTQAVPIFAAGTAVSSSSTAQPAVSTPLPPAPSSNTARFPQLRSATLRGVAIPGQVKRISSNPPPDGSRAGNTPLPLPPHSPLPPASASGASGEQRDRLDRTRRGIGPQESQSQSAPAASAPEPADVPAQAESDDATAPALRGDAVDATAPALRGDAVDATAPALRGGAVDATAPALRGGASSRPAAEAKAARTGTDSDRAAEATPTAPRSDRPVRPASAVATQNGAPAPSTNERPARERPSDRPPRPGGTDDLRTRAAQPAAPSGPPEAGSGSRPRDVAFARTTLKEVAVGFRDAAAGRIPPATQAAPAARQLSANAGFPRAERDTTEKRIPIASDITRYDRGSAPEFEQERSNSRWLLWLIAGTGLLMSYFIVRMFGGGLPGIPGETISAEVSSSAKAASNTPPTHENHMPYVLAVTTQPAGARVTAAGVSVVAPGDLRLDGLQPPLQVEAELAGYEKASATLWPSQFERNGNTYEGKLALTLQAAANAASAAPKEPVKTAAESAPPAAKPHDSGHAAAPARSSANEGRHKDSPTPARRPAKVAAATVVITPAAPSPPPAPTPSSAPLVATPQQTPLAEALDCLARGDNRCVIRALEDKATTAREFELLIETYRAVGSTPRAERQMQSYLQRFPDGQRAAEYRRLLERRAPSANPAESAPPPQAP